MLKININNAVIDIILTWIGMISFFILIFILINNTDSINKKIFVGTAVNHQKKCKPMEINMFSVTIRKNDTKVCK